jgi:murein DD-endopeptidase MepM/ murein hydrolase activator NlpD
MKKVLILKKIKFIIEPYLKGFLRFCTKFFKFIFTKRTILFVTNQKIRSLTFGPFAQLSCYIIVAWVVNLFFQSLNYDKIINEKSQEIRKLRTANNYFSEEFKMANEKLEKINQYFFTVTGSPLRVNSKTKEFIEPKDLDADNLNKKDKTTLNEIKNSRQHFSSFFDATEFKIKKIETAINKTGLRLNKPSINAEKIKKNHIKEFSLNNKNEQHQMSLGGPENDLDTEIDAELSKIKLSDDIYLEQKIEQAKFNNNIDYLIVLEKLVKSLPLSQPMKNYYMSSGFGTRIDPITKRHTPHRGLDFVGSYREKVISPSPGKVVLARWFSDYGNAIVIDHGNGITTRYGHLSKIKVSEGQRVKTGQVIGHQGNTGRSTGQHLHYEVRYKNVPLNPKKFIEAGKVLINNESPKYLDI